MSDVFNVPTYDFGDKVVVVTGGSNGIGAEIADQFERAGATVVIWDVARPSSERANYVEVDVSDSYSVDAAMQQTIQRFVRVDILSHNAGFSGATVPVVDTDTADWANVVAVNLTGTYHVCRVVAKDMVARGNGRIVNMASLAGKEGTPTASAYSAAKAGVIAFTKSLAKELANTEIRVNAVAPAALKTAILDQMTVDFVQTMINKSPMGRLGTVDEAAQLVLWLSSGACTFNSGAVFDLSGGRATY